MGAQPLPGMAQQRRDRDVFDQICDHLLVLDHSRGSGADAVVGTYRLIRRVAAETARRVSIRRPNTTSHPDRLSRRILELGRSCVDAGYRGRGRLCSSCGAASPPMSFITTSR